MPVSVRRIWGLFGERRGLGRVEQNLAVSFVVLAGSTGEPVGPAQAARMVNLSAGGGCLAVAGLALGAFHLFRCLETPEEHPLVVTVPTRGGLAWRLRGQIRWTNREMQPEDGTLPFRVGLQWESGAGPPADWRRQLALTTGD
ncbi:MAG: hypothetical protein V1797_10560 [Pseudomonadota bacterium]